MKLFDAFLYHFKNHLKLIFETYFPPFKNTIYYALKKTGAVDVSTHKQLTAGNKKQEGLSKLKQPVSTLHVNFYKSYKPVIYLCRVPVFMVHCAVVVKIIALLGITGELFYLCFTFCLISIVGKRANTSVGATTDFTRSFTSRYINFYMICVSGEIVFNLINVRDCLKKAWLIHNIAPD